jgi:hypothetical protein
VYLASTRSDWLTGRVIGARGYQISLYNNPEVVRELSADAAWDFQAACEAIEREFKPVVEATPSRRRA